MKKILVLLSAICAVLLGQPALATEAGELAPDFSLSDISGNTVKLSDFKGKVVYLDFWASWCGPCKQSFPWMNEMHVKYAGQGLQIVAVNLDTKPESAKQFLTGNPASFTVLLDPASSTPSKYKIKGMPTSILIGAHGKIVSRHAGFKASEIEALEAEIKQALAKK